MQQGNLCGYSNGFRGASKLPAKDYEERRRIKLNLDKDSLRKYLAELVGTFVLVVFGCGTAVVTQCSTDNYPGYILTALAFGLVIVAMAYSIGNISGCHINPAVSLAMLVNKKMPVKDFAGYVIAQFAGGIIGAAVLLGVLGTENGLGANGLYNGNFGGSFVVEVILTFVFVLAVLGVTSRPAFSSNAGLVIGFSLTLVHLFGIGLTGTSVNPARSLGPALMLGGDALSDVWVFIIAPLVGGVLAAVLYQFLDTAQPEAAAAPVQEKPSAPVISLVPEGASDKDEAAERSAAPEASAETVKADSVSPEAKDNAAEDAIPEDVPEAAINGTTIRTADLFVTLPKQTAFSVDTGVTKISVAAPGDENADEVNAIETQESEMIALNTDDSTRIMIAADDDASESEEEYTETDPDIADEDAALNSSETSGASADYGADLEQADADDADEAYRTADGGLSEDTAVSETMDEIAAIESDISEAVEEASMPKA